MLGQGHAAGAFLPRDPVKLSFEIIVNAVDGSSRSGCETSDEVQAYRKMDWWVAVAETSFHPQKAWQGVGSGIRCGSASADTAASIAEDGSGHAYLVAGVSTVAGSFLRIF